MARLIDADALMKEVCGLKCGCMPDECGYDYNGDKYCEAAQYIENAPTAFDVKILMAKLATLDRIAKSDKQKALLGRVFFIIENMIEENEREQNNDTDTTDSEIHD